MRRCFLDLLFYLLLVVLVIVGSSRFLLSLSRNGLDDDPSTLLTDKNKGMGTATVNETVRERTSSSSSTSPSERHRPQQGATVNLTGVVRPLLDDLVFNKTTVHGDVQFLLQFALIGHGKCGTTALLNHLRNHPEIQMPQLESSYLSMGEIGSFVQEMYELPADDNVLRGYKSPKDVSIRQSRQLLARYFPRTKLVVGIRHPILWFQSWYNFHSRLDRTKLPPAESYAGGMYNLPQHIQFHVHLAMMFKTPMVEKGELELLRPFTSSWPEPSDAMRNQVFLYEYTQPFDANETRAEQFAHDLGQFIAVSKPLASLPHIPNAHRSFDSDIDICVAAYDGLRSDLLKLGTAASTWITRYFLDAEGVTVSSREHFVNVMRTWTCDPCFPLTCPG